MKLIRYGHAGYERPGMIDADGVLRELSDVVDDIEGEVLTEHGLAKLRDVEIERLGSQRQRVMPATPNHRQRRGLSPNDR